MLRTNILAQIKDKLLAIISVVFIFTLLLGLWQVESTSVQAAQAADAVQISTGSLPWPGQTAEFGTSVTIPYGANGVVNLAIGELDKFVSVPTVSGIGTYTGNMLKLRVAMLSPDEVLIASGAPIVVTHYKIDTANQANVLSTVTYGDANARLGDFIRLSNGAVVLTWHENVMQTVQPWGVNIGFAYRSPAGVWSQLPYTFVPTLSQQAVSQQTLAEHPVDDSVWEFSKSDATPWIGAIHLTPTDSSLNVDWVNGTFLSASDGDMEPESEFPWLVAVPDASRASILLGYQNCDYHIFSSSPFLKGAKIAITKVAANGTKSLLFVTNEYIERTMPFGLNVSSGQIRLAYQPMDAQGSWSDLYVNNTQGLSKDYGPIYKLWPYTVFAGSDKMITRLPDGGIYAIPYDNGATVPNPTDSTAPYTSGWAPAKSSTGMPLNTNIVFHVQDDGAGVDMSSIVMTLQGSQITPTITGTPTDYTVTYDPPTDFVYGQVVNITVNAKDLASPSNVMPTDSYSFNVVNIDHYSVSSISSPQITGTPFSVTIQAQDQYNNNINTGSETVNIAFGQTDAGAAPTSTTTTNGTATVSLNMTKAQSGQSIIFTGANSNKTGISNLFDVNAGVINHYSVSSISSPQTVGTAFNVTIQAQDQYNNNINTGSETVNLSFGQTDAGAAPTSTTTTNGTATVNLIMAQTQSGQAVIFTGVPSQVSGTSNTFTVDAGTTPLVPTLNSPVNSSTVSSLTPELQWNASTGATSYGVQVSTNSSFSTTVINLSGINNTIYDVLSGKLGYSTTYYWRVNASNTYGTSSWSNNWLFITPSQPQPPAAPILISPTSSSTVSTLTPTIQWNASIGATSYGVQISTSYSFTSLITNQTGINNTFYNVLSGKLGYSTTYYWRVNASNANGTSNWSSYWLFKTPSKPQPPTTPALISPTYGSTVSSLTIPTLQWNASTGATSYGVQVSTSYRFTSVLINQTGITAPSFSVPTSALKTNVTYYWRVNASNANGTSSWSSYRQFKISTSR